MAKTKILAFAGSTRKESWNKKLVKMAAADIAGQDVEVTLIDLADYPMPFYDGDIESEHGLPENARKLKQLFAEHDGFLISTPDYNGSFPAVLKNALDWISRREPGAPVLIEPFQGKVAGLLSCSPGKGGGLRAIEKLRVQLSDIGVMVLPEIYAVGGITTAFNEAGKLSDEKVAANVHKLGEKLVKTAKNLSLAA